MARQHRKGESIPDAGLGEVERSCIVHRQAKPTDDMVRFVIGPDDTVVPDLKCVLPGRGIWVTATKQDIDFAVRKELFSQASKAAVHADEGLGDRIEQMLEAATLSALGFSAKAGLVVTGFEKVQATLDKNQLRALVFASDGAEDGIRKMRSKLKQVVRAKKIAVHQSLRCEQMALALGRLNVIHAALLKGGATDLCLKTMSRLERFRSPVMLESTSEDVENK